MPADTAIQDHEHGTHRGHAQHRANGTPPCLPCYDGESDYHMAWRVRNRNKNIPVPLGSMRRILAGEDPATVLAETFGPLTLAAVREYGLIDAGVGRG